MSSLSSLSSSTNATYATQLAQTSALERGLYNLGSAVQSGDLATAGSVLNSLIEANPQYALSSTNASPSSDPINQDFQNLAKAISNDQPDTAKSVWTQLKSDLAKAGVTSINSGSQIAAQAMAQSRESTEESLMTDLFGAPASGGSSVATLIGAGSDSSGANNAVSSLVGAWLTYQADATSSTLPSSQTSSLNTVA
jgi:hypothetical protein